MSHRAQSGLFRHGKFLISIVMFVAFPGMPVFSQQEQRGGAQPWEAYNIQLTPEEIAWIDSHPVLRLGCDPAWPPYSFRNANGELQGIDVDFFACLKKRLGITFEPIATQSWKETARKIPTGEVDVVSGLGRTEEREKYLLFTSSYTSTSLAVITRQEAPFLTSMHDLKNVTLASPRGYISTEKLIKDYPNLPLIQTATVLDALTLVSRGRADMTVENLAVTSYFIKSGGLTNLKIAGIADYHFDLCFGVRKDWPELRSILQKGLDSISQAERREMLEHWTAVEYFPHPDWSRIWKIGAGFLFAALAVFAMFARWNRRLACELVERRKTEAALTTANDRLQALNREKDRFMGMAAHDLNNPLTAIIMKCAVFEMQEDFSRESVHEFLPSVQNYLQRMSQLVKNLLNADRMEHGQIRLQVQALDLSALARETVESMRPCAECKDIRIEFAAPPFPVRVKADRDATLQVLENLISNAIKFTPPGKTVAVRVVERDGVARFEVQDQGPGISEEDRPKLFGKYVTLSARPTANEPSNGLGLSIARNLVESMKGAIRCESKTGEGALFVVEFPALSGVESVAT